MRFHSKHFLGALALSLVATAGVAQQRPEIARADIGFGNRYKIGCWTPLRLQFDGGDQTVTAMAEVRVPDSEGNVTAVPTPPFSIPAGEAKTVELLVRIGQLDSPVEVRLRRAETGRQIARRVFDTRRAVDDRGVPPGEPATTRMIVEVGPTNLGTTAIEAEQTSQRWYTQNVVAHVSDLAELPRNLLAYESVEVVLLSTSDRDTWASLRADDPRMRALDEWVEQGGRVVLFCGSQSDVVLAPGGALARLAPGDFRGTVTVDDLTPLETYISANEPLPNRGRFQLSVPRLENVRGQVELALGGRENRLPVVVRARHGLGQVVFVGFDIDSGPLRNWNSRTALVDRLLALGDEELPTDSDNYYYDGPSDVTASLIQRLDLELERSGIRTIPFLAIAGLVFLYILLIGPGDYLFVKYVLKKMEWTWVTFPAIVILTCVGAYVYADYLKGDDLRINQLEIVDVDTTTGQTRGTMWTHIFSPSPDRYTLALAARSPSGEAAALDRSAVAWLGRPASGMGGMNSEAGMQLGAPAYGWSPDLAALLGVPIEVWSTKTFTARWQSQSPATVESDLQRTSSNLVAGTITNPTDVDLVQCKLVYGTWSWQLGDLPAGETVEIEQASVGNTASGPRRLRNSYREEYDFDVSQGSYYERQQLVRHVELRGLAEMMMFYDALGGRRQTQQWNRYQHFLDLSHAMDGNTAMLVGECRQPRSELVRIEDEEPESMRGEKDFYVVLYRLLLPVKPVPE